MNSNINYSLHYKRWHSGNLEYYEKIFPFYKKLFLKILPRDKNIKILDVGCAFGASVYALNKMGYKSVKGIDISKELIKVAERNGLNVEYVEDSVQYLLSNENTYDVILMLDVFEHIPLAEQLSFLKAIYASLKQEGMLICTVPNANSTFASRWRYIDWTHTCSFTECSLEFVILNAGFKTVHIEELEFITRPKHPILIRKSVIQWLLFKCIRFFRRLQAIAELGAQGRKIPLSLNLLAIAEK